MIHPPRRSVTRFFVPFIDVLILLFCIFLLMPFVQSTAEPSLEKDSDENSFSQQAIRLQIEQQQNEIEQLRANLEHIQTRSDRPQDRFAVKILEIDSGDGSLFTFENGKKFTINSEADSQNLMDRQRQKYPEKEPFVLILYPRVLSGYPEQGQIDRYQDWFRDYPIALDRPYTMIKKPENRKGNIK